MVDISAEELKRVGRLIDSVLPSLTDLYGKVEWEGAGRETYDRRLRECGSLLEMLRTGLARAAPALDDYSQALVRAKKKIEEGDAAAEELKKLIAPIVETQSKWVREAEPLAQWEDLREITGFTDWINEQAEQDRINEIRGAAEHHYTTAAHCYSDAKKIEEEARTLCVSALREAFRLLPDFRANSQEAEQIIGGTPGLLAEMEQASHDPNARLPGQGLIPTLRTEHTELTDLHQDIVDRMGKLSLDGPTWGNTDTFNWYALGNREDEDKFKRKWIYAYRSVIETAAREYGIPASVLAGVAYKEVGGKPMWMDGAVDTLRQWHLYSGEPNQTSYGPMSIQVKAAAESLGYDPAKLTDRQREQIIKSLEDPEQSIFIAAKHLADLKQTTDFAYKEPHEMTAEEGEVLAAKYNGGPYWEGPDAQAYAKDYRKHLEAATDALQNPPE
ncbi:hypothetical protein TH66_12305 [Carbonactinospora thermoautotrophica]|nr:hypothetical protein TH66_12305 [Carbonactinospora thermoautotrophica]KWX09003.1 hypothetical protein TR74_12240 [Carbonactinospora thermoautotrophica]